MREDAAGKGVELHGRILSGTTDAGDVEEVACAGGLEATGENNEAGQSSGVGKIKNLLSGVRIVMFAWSGGGQKSTSKYGIVTAPATTENEIFGINADLDQCTRCSTPK